MADHYGGPSQSGNPSRPAVQPDSTSEVTVEYIKENDFGPHKIKKYSPRSITKPRGVQGTGYYISRKSEKFVRKVSEKTASASQEKEVERKMPVSKNGRAKKPQSAKSEVNPSPAVKQQSTVPATDKTTEQKDEGEEPLHTPPGQESGDPSNPTASDQPMTAEIQPESVRPDSESLKTQTVTKIPPPVSTPNVKTSASVPGPPHNTSAVTSPKPQAKNLVADTISSIVSLFGERKKKQMVSPGKPSVSPATLALTPTPKSTLRQSVEITPKQANLPVASETLLKSPINQKVSSPLNTLSTISKSSEELVTLPRKTSVAGSKAASVKNSPQAAAMAAKPAESETVSESWKEQKKPQESETSAVIELLKSTVRMDRPSATGAGAPISECPAATPSNAAVKVTENVKATIEPPVVTVVNEQVAKTSMGPASQSAETTDRKTVSKKVQRTPPPKEKDNPGITSSPPILLSTMEKLKQKVTRKASQPQAQVTSVGGEGNREEQAQIESPEKSFTKIIEIEQRKLPAGEENEEKLNQCEKQNVVFQNVITGKPGSEDKEPDVPSNTCSNPSESSQVLESTETESQFTSVKVNTEKSAEDQKVDGSQNTTKKRQRKKKVVEIVKTFPLRSRRKPQESPKEPKFAEEEGTSDGTGKGKQIEDQSVDISDTIEDDTTGPGQELVSPCDSVALNKSVTPNKPVKKRKGRPPRMSIQPDDVNPPALKEDVQEQSPLTCTPDQNESGNYRDFDSTPLDLGSSPQNMPSYPVRKRRGRPPRNQTESPLTIKVIEVHPAESSLSGTNTQRKAETPKSEMDSSSQVTPSNPVKKRRGRLPRKSVQSGDMAQAAIPLAIQMGEDFKDDSISASNQDPVVNDKTLETSTSELDSSAPNKPNKPVKKKRGRPPWKNIKPKDTEQIRAPATLNQEEVPLTSTLQSAGENSIEESSDTRCSIQDSVTESNPVSTSFPSPAVLIVDPVTQSTPVSQGHPVKKRRGKPRKSIQSGDEKLAPSPADPIAPAIEVKRRGRRPRKSAQEIDDTESASPGIGIDDKGAPLSATLTPTEALGEKTEESASSLPEGPAPDPGQPTDAVAPSDQITSVTQVARVYPLETSNTDVSTGPVAPIDSLISVTEVSTNNPVVVHNLDSSQVEQVQSPGVLASSLTATDKLDETSNSTLPNEAVTASNLEKKRPGRPRRKSVQPVDQNHPASPITPVTTNNPLKRRRGRPPRTAIQQGDGKLPPSPLTIQTEAGFQESLITSTPKHAVVSRLRRQSSRGTARSQMQCMESDGQGSESTSISGDPDLESVVSEDLSFVSKDSLISVYEEGILFNESQAETESSVGSGYGQAVAAEGLPKGRGRKRKRQLSDPEVEPGSETTKTKSQTRMPRRKAKAPERAPVLATPTNDTLTETSSVTDLSSNLSADITFDPSIPLDSDFSKEDLSELPNNEGTENISTDSLDALEESKNEQVTEPPAKIRCVGKTQIYRAKQSNVMSPYRYGFPDSTSEEGSVISIGTEEKTPKRLKVPQKRLPKVECDICGHGIGPTYLKRHQALAHPGIASKLNTSDLPKSLPKKKPVAGPGTSAKQSKPKKQKPAPVGEETQTTKPSDVLPAAESPKSDTSLPVTPAKLVKSFNCSNCGATFKTPVGLRVHERCCKLTQPPREEGSHLSDLTEEVTPAKRIDCTRCGRTYKTAASLWIHTKRCKTKSPKEEGNHLSNLTKKATPAKRFDCAYCGETYKTAAGLALHTKWCKTKSPKEEGNHLSNLTKKATPAKRFDCAYCGETYKTAAGLALHTKRCKTKDPLKDNGNSQVKGANDADGEPQDGRQAARKAKTFISELAAPKPERPKKKRRYLLPKEKQVTKYFKLKWEKDLAEHGLLTCPLVISGCGFTTSSIEDLKTHYLSCSFHSNKKTYKCVMCDHGSASETLARRHARTHPWSDDDGSTSESSIASEIDDEDADPDAFFDLHLDREETYTPPPKAKRVRARSFATPTPAKRRATPAKSPAFSTPRSKPPASCTPRSKSRITMERLEMFQDSMHWTKHWYETSEDAALGKMAAWRPRSHQWRHLPADEAECYLPVDKHSVFFSHHGSDQGQKSLGRFESTNDSLSLLYTGGPIWAMDWLSTPIGLERTQYLALYCHRQHDVHHSAQAVTAGPGTIQLWDCGTMINETLSRAPRLSLVLTHEEGAIWCLKWCPRRCWGPPGGVGGNLPWLGVLAAGASSGKVNIYSVPVPESLRRSENGGPLPVYAVKPVLTLCLLTPSDSSGRGAGLTGSRSLDWQLLDGSRHVLAGYGSGHVGLYNLGTESRLLRSSPGKGQPDELRPIVVIWAHVCPVTGLAFCQRRPDFFTTVSQDRQLKVWNLDQLESPLNAVQKSEYTAVIWPLHWAAIFAATDNCYCLEHNALFMIDTGYFGIQNRPLTVHNASIMDACYSEWLNTVVSVDSSGAVEAMYLPYLTLTHKHHKSFSTRRMLMYMTTCDPLEPCKCVSPIASVHEPAVHPTTTPPATTPCSFHCVLCRRPLPTTAAPSHSKSAPGSADEDEADGHTLLSSVKKVMRTMEKSNHTATPQTVTEMGQTSALTFTDKSLGLLNTDKEMRIKTAKDLRPDKLDPLLPAHYKASFNPNLGSHLWLAVGGEAGFVRLTYLTAFRSTGAQHFTRTVFDKKGGKKAGRGRGHTDTVTEEGVASDVDMEDDEESTEVTAPL